MHYIFKQGNGPAEGVSYGWDESITTVGPSFNISDETRGERPLLRVAVPLTRLLCPYLPSHSTSIVSHFPLQPFSPLFGPIIFLSALCPRSPYSYIVWYNFPSSFRIISLMPPSSSLCSCTLLSLPTVFSPVLFPVCSCHHHIWLPLATVKSLSETRL